MKKKTDEAVKKIAKKKAVAQNAAAAQVMVPRVIRVEYEWDGVCRELDDVLRDLFGELGYENPDSGFFFPEKAGDPGTRDLTFEIPDGSED